MYKKILVAIDGSDTSKLALKESIKLAKEFDAKLRIVYVVDFFNVYPEVEYISVKDVQESMQQEGKTILEGTMRALKSSSIPFSQHLLKTTSKNPRIAEAIASDAQKWKADLIVVGTHGRRGFSHFFLGSVAESIVRVATKPVLLIRGGAK